MTRFQRWWAFAVLFLAGPAGATFHLWGMQELYSNADGTVQYMVMSTTFSGQQAVLGHVLLTSSPGQPNQGYSITTNLPGDSAGKKVLFATQGFAALNIVTPDFVVPNGFFFRNGGSVDWGHGADVWAHPALPTSGGLALLRNGTTAINAPTNFAGQTGRIPSAPAAAANYQALWWSSPANSESGWGVNITHQGEVLFATWFTYDADGPMWLVMSEGRLTGTNTYSGALYRTTGPAFSASPFNSSQVAATQVGTATFTFSDANTATFNYTVNGVTQAKPIMRQVYASPVPNCTADTTGPSATNFQDLWWRSPGGSESGWGVNITHQGDLLFATWFTYAVGGKGMWLVMSEGRRTAANTYSGTLYRTSGQSFSAVPWSSAQVRVTEAGTGTFTFTDANNGTFAYTVDGVSQSKAITRQAYASPPTVCR